MHTRLCDLFGINHPVLLAPMGGYGGPDLVAAVSEAGGLGLLAATWTDLPGLLDEIRQIRRLTSRPFGVNFVLHLADPAAIDRVLDEGVAILSTFRGDPTSVIAKAKAAGALTLHQVTTEAEVHQAVQAGVDAVIAQGNEAGGHGGPEPLWSFLPKALAAAGDVPVIAAGGIIDGRGLAAALALGASGVSMGTRFLATPESAATPSHKRALLDSQPGDTLYSQVWDDIWGEVWPGIKVRALRNAALDRWHGRPDDLARDLARARAGLAAATARDDAEEMPLLAGTGAGHITAIVPAGQLVRAIVAEADQVIRALSGSLSGAPKP